MNRGNLVFFLFFLSFFLFIFLENLHSRRMSISTPAAAGQPSGAWPQRGQLSAPLGHNFKTQQCWITLVRFCWMLYRRNCNTLLSSSLQRCYINGVCFAFQLAALWKRRSVICPWEHQLIFKFETNKELEVGGLFWDSRLYSTQHTYVFFGTMRKRSPQRREMDDQVTSALDTVHMFCSMSNNRAAAPPQPGSQSAVVNQSNPINRQLFG